MQCRLAIQRRIGTVKSEDGRVSTIEIVLDEMARKDEDDTFTPAMSAATRELATPSILRAVLEHRGLNGGDEPCNLSKVRKQRNAD